MAMQESAVLETLSRVFGYHGFVGMQEAVVGHVLAGGDAVVLMPTGGGKSMCYQLPALLRPGMGLVVSPLIALMLDQVAALRQNGVAAACLTSSQGPQESRDILDAMRAGRLELLYVAPERLMQPWFQDQLRRTPLALAAIDEAHCVSQWGHNFRPEYLQLACLKELFPGVPRLALTATADPPTRRDIQTQLQMEDARVFVSSFDRPNITYAVELRHRAEKTLIQRIRTRHKGQAGIVYRMSRKKVEDTAQALVDAGLPALAYHAGLPARQRAQAQERFMREDGVVMVATVAFGMGVDKPDVRYVAHLDPPKSLEAYHQETGRAGRDGLPAEAWMVYGMEDLVRLSQMLESESPPEGIPEDQYEQFQRIQREKLYALFGYCETASCRRQALLHYFGQELPEPCGACDTCLHPPRTVDATVAAQKALSCVFRTRERGSVSMLADILTGTATKAVLAWGFRELSTFGIGTELSKQQWQSLYRQLLVSGKLRVSYTDKGFTNLHLTPASWDILKGRATFSMRVEDPAAAKSIKAEKSAKSARSGRSRSAEQAEQDPAGQAFFEALRALRRKLADEQEVPAYVIFHDRALWEMVAEQPETEAQFAAVLGVGVNKAAKYGEAFLQVIDEHRRRGSVTGPGVDAGTGTGTGVAPAPLPSLGTALKTTPGAHMLFAELTREREVIAARYGEDPDQLFSDEALAEMALHRPRTLAALGLVKGARTLPNLLHGPALLQVIARYDQEHGRPTTIRDLANAYPDRVLKQQADTQSSTAEKSLASFRELGSVEAVAKARELTAATIYKHLEQAVRRGKLQAIEVVGLNQTQWQALEASFGETAAKGFWRVAPYAQAYKAALGREDMEDAMLFFIHNIIVRNAWDSVLRNNIKT